MPGKTENATKSHGFPPVVDANAKVLVLGSMPGSASLEARQYYAHVRNIFWRIMGDLVGADPKLPYAMRLRILTDNRIALWDVLKTCVRPGSLDANIEKASIVVNDFRAFYRSHPQIAHVFFNGAKAEEYYLKYVLPTLDRRIGPVEFRRLPSTSPAHASLSYPQKLQAWSIVRFPERSVAAE